MQLKVIASAILIVFSVISLNACTHTGKKNGTQSNSSAYTSADAQTSGAGSRANFNGDAQQNAKKVTAKTTYYFEFDRSVVRSQDLPAIYAQANYLIDHPQAKIILEGHTDPRGSREYNVGLGERRANAIAEILKSKGVASNQIRILSYGAERLAASGRTEQDYQLDRRSIVVHIQG